MNVTAFPVLSTGVLGGALLCAAAYLCIALVSIQSGGKALAQWKGQKIR